MNIYTVIEWLTVVNLLLAVQELYLLHKRGRAATETERERIDMAFALMVLLPLAFTLPKGIIELYGFLLAGLIKMNIENILSIQKLTYPAASNGGSLPSS